MNSLAQQLLDFLGPSLLFVQVIQIFKVAQQVGKCLSLKNVEWINTINLRIVE